MWNVLIRICMCEQQAHLSVCVCVWVCVCVCVCVCVFQCLQPIVTTCDIHRGWHSVPSGSAVSVKCSCVSPHRYVSSCRGPPRIVCVCVCVCVCVRFASLLLYSPVSGQVNLQQPGCSSSCWTQAAWRVRGCRCRGWSPGSSVSPGSSRTAAGGTRRACRRRRRSAGSNGRAPSSCGTAETRTRAPPRTVTSSGRCLDGTQRRGRFTTWNNTATVHNYRG